MRIPNREIYEMPERLIEGRSSFGSRLLFVPLACFAVIHLCTLENGGKIEGRENDWENGIRRRLEKGKVCVGCVAGE